MGKGGRTALADRGCHRLEDINRSCLDQFRTHWQCLENNNQQLWQCRGEEWKLSACVFDKLVCSVFLPRAALHHPVHLHPCRILSCCPIELLNPSLILTPPSPPHRNSKRKSPESLQTNNPSISETARFSPRT